MTVKELIEKLKAYPDDAWVHSYETSIVVSKRIQCDGGYTIPDEIGYISATEYRDAD